MDQLNKGTRVLVVDDDQTIREIVADALDEDGCEVRCVSSGTEALEEIGGASPFDVVLTDLSMRGMDGLQLLEVLKREHPKLDVIILTGYASLESALQAMRLGAADYLRKPVRQAEIVYSVRQARLRRRILDENEALRGCLQTFEASRVLASCLEVGDVLPLALDLVLRLTDRRCAIGRLDLSPPRVGDGVVVVGFDDHVAGRLRSEMERGELFALDTLDLEEGVANAATPDVLERLSRLGLSESRILALPLCARGERVGGIWVLGGHEDFDVEERRRCDVLVAQTELAIANAERFHQASEKAFVDDVTDLYNSRYLMSALDREVSRADRAESELSVLFLDLDRFKDVNDTRGHLVGTHVLRQLGAQLSHCVRSIDTLARYGGDEFTVLLVDTRHDEGLEVAERIRQLVEAHDFGDAGGSIRLTVSIGVATFPQHGRARREILECADQAMYLAKAQGRNRVCSADALETRSDSA